MHLVYWYGAELRWGFGWIEQKEWSKKFISFEDGRSKGYLDIPSSIMKKVETCKKLTKLPQYYASKSRENKRNMYYIYLVVYDITVLLTSLFF